MIQDFLLRARRPKSLVDFNSALPTNFKLIHKPENEWLELSGVNLISINNLDLVAASPGIPAVLSTAIHYNLRVTPQWSGWDGLIIESGEPGFGDSRLNRSKVKRWFKNNGVERLDAGSEHPRSGRTDMRWWRWTDGTEWMDITIDEPQRRRRIWLGDVL